MAQSDIDNRPNLNTGTEWPQMDLTDLMDMLLRGESNPHVAPGGCWYLRPNRRAETPG